MNISSHLEENAYKNADAYDQLNLTTSERNERLPSGVSTYLQNRIGWSISYLKQAGLLHYPERGKVRITDRGLEVLTTKPDV